MDATTPPARSSMPLVWVLPFLGLLGLLAYALFHKKELVQPMPIQDAVTPSAPRGPLVAAVPDAGLADTSETWAHHRGKVPFILGFKKGMDAAAKSRRPPMLFFTTTWCGWCKKLADESFKDADVVQALTQYTPIIVDGDTEQDVVGRYGVQGFPTIVFANSKGEPVQQIGGYVSKDRFLDVAKRPASGR